MRSHRHGQRGRGALSSLAPLSFLIVTSLFAGCESDAKHEPAAEAVEGPCTALRSVGPAVAADDATLARVRSELAFAWTGYATYAFGHDELKPISKTAADWYGVPMGLTIVDALDTLHVAGLTSERDQALAWIKGTLSFDRDIEVSAFETNIRYLGGLLSAYRLLGEPRLLPPPVSLHSPSLAPSHPGRFRRPR